MYGKQEYFHSLRELSEIINAMKRYKMLALRIFLKDGYQSTRVESEAPETLPENDCNGIEAVRELLSGALLLLSRALLLP